MFAKARSAKVKECILQNNLDSLSNLRLYEKKSWGQKKSKNDQKSNFVKFQSLLRILISVNVLIPCGFGRSGIRRGWTVEYWCNWRINGAMIINFASPSIWTSSFHILQNNSHWILGTSLFRLFGLLGKQLAQLAQDIMWWKTAAYNLYTLALWSNCSTAMIEHDWKLSTARVNISATFAFAVRYLNKATQV